jgi:hypothetical protein
MPTEQESKQHKDEDKQQRERLNAKIGDLVLASLGQPRPPHRVQVRRLWKDHFRVNVLVGADAMGVKVAHSYFLVADHEGNIITATPPLRLPLASIKPAAREDAACANS